MSSQCHSTDLGLGADGRRRGAGLFIVLTVFGVGGAILAQHVQHTGKGQVKVTQLSQRDIIEKLDGKATSETVVEVTFEPGQKDAPHHHAGPVFGYVLGSMSCRSSSAPAESMKLRVTDLSTFLWRSSDAELFHSAS
jgi:hypothetical protein